MDDELRMTEESPDYSIGGLVDSLATGNSGQAAACALCSRTFSPDNPVTADCDLCGDCKFLCLESLENPMHESYQRRTSRRQRRSSRRTSRYSSSESIEDVFSQQFSQMISIMRQNHATSHEQDSHVDGETSVRSWQQNSSRYTPSGSRRWRSMLSDTDSDGFDNMESLYGESESNFSFGRFNIFHGDSDAISMSTYGGESDASVEDQNFLGADVLARPNEGSDLDSDSDTDIDPMHAGVRHWGLDIHNEGEEDGEGGWEDTDIEENAVETQEHRDHLRNSPSTGQIVRDELILLPDFEDVISVRFRSRRHENFRIITSNVVELDQPSYDGNSGDYLDAIGFEELLAHLAENDSSRRGAPPTSASYINSLPIVTMREEHAKQDGITCAICKDTIAVGSRANQLPCLHLYHPSCILPWLSSRNSCPLCRYELPTDDKEYEESKQADIRRMHHIDENMLQTAVEESSYNEAEAAEGREMTPSDMEQTDELVGDSSTDGLRAEGGRGRWLYLAATPILGLMGMALVLWFGNPLVQRRQTANNFNIFEAVQPRVNTIVASPTPRADRNRRWWPFY